MKFTESFVTNSSSTSFILEIPSAMTTGKQVLKSAEDVLTFCDKEYELDGEYGQEIYSKLLTIVNRGNKAMVASISTDGDVYQDFIDLMESLGIGVELLDD
jgi:hypothetical protein